MAGLALMAAIAGIWFVPFLTRERVVTASTPTVRPFFQATRVQVPARERECVEPVIFEPLAQTAAVQVVTNGRAGPPLEVVATSAGYRARGQASGGYADGATIVVDLSATASRTTPDGTLCLVNRGRNAIALVGPAEPRSAAPVRVTVGNKPVREQFSVTLAARRPASVLARPGRILERASAFRPVGPAVLWPLALLVALGVPALVLLAIARSIAVDDEPDTRRHA